MADNIVQEKIYSYVVRTDTTITELISNPKSLFYKYNGDRQKFLSIELDGENNESRITRFYGKVDRKANETVETIYAQTVLAIPESQSNIELFSVKGQNLFLTQNDSYEGFYARKLKELMESKEYIPAKFVKDRSGNVLAQIKEHNYSVWIWIRALNQIIDISPFVASLNTSVSSSGGTFDFSTVPINDINSYIKSVGGQYITYFNNQKADNNKVNIDYFHKKIQQNDVVFIRFEKLVGEKDRDIKGNLEFGVNPSNLPNKIYDMIGLIDSSSCYYNASIGDMSVNFSGRDLMKLFYEDGSYFFPTSMISGVDTVLFDTTSESKWFKRNFAFGEIKNLFIYSRRTIADTIGFIINQLANISVVPDDLFSAYSSSTDSEEKNRNQVLNITGADSQYLEYNEVKGIWQILKVQTDSYINDRMLANSQISRPDGTLFEQLNNICQKPFVEVFGDTYGANYNLIVRQPPFTKQSILSWLNYDDKEGSVIRIKASDVYSYNLQWETEYYTWYQLAPQDAFIGQAQKIGMGYLPVVWIEEFAEAFGNHRLVIPDCYQSVKAYQGYNKNENVSKFKEAIVNDFKLILDSYVYLPFTRRGTITINGDRRIKYGTWIIFEPTNEVFYVDSVQNSGSVSENSVDRTTILQVKRGMVYDYVVGKGIVTNEKGEQVTIKGGIINVKDQVIKNQPFRNNTSVIGAFKTSYLYTRSNPTYFDIVNTNLIKEILINKFASNNRGVLNISRAKEQTKGDFFVNKEVFDFFLKRKQFD